MIFSACVCIGVAGIICTLRPRSAGRQLTAAEERRWLVRSGELQQQSIGALMDGTADTIRNRMSLREGQRGSDSGDTRATVRGVHAPEAKDSLRPHASVAPLPGDGSQIAHQQAPGMLAMA